VVANAHEKPRSGCVVILAIIEFVGSAQQSAGKKWSGKNSVILAGSATASQRWHDSLRWTCSRCRHAYLGFVCCIQLSVHIPHLQLLSGWRSHLQSCLATSEILSDYVCAQRDERDRAQVGGRKYQWDCIWPNIERWDTLYLSMNLPLSPCARFPGDYGARRWSDACWIYTFEPQAQFDAYESQEIMLVSLTMNAKRYVVGTQMTDVRIALWHLTCPVRRVKAR
jgi:hypothetical protein